MRSKISEDEYRLPGGKHVSFDNYIEYWRAKAKVIEDLTSLKHSGFDPDILFYGENDWESISLPLWFISLIEERVKK